MISGTLQSVGNVSADLQDIGHLTGVLGGQARINATLQAMLCMSAVLTEAAHIQAELTLPKGKATSPFTGEYEYTPSQETQRIPIEGLRATQDIIIDPIPQNYGLITWNGSTITVS